MGKFIDLTNQDFNEWHVDAYLGKQMWQCTCSCGKVKAINGADLRNGKSTSCGHTRKMDHTNEIVGDYKIVKYLGDYRWDCECLDCGEHHKVHTYFIEHNKLPKCLHGETDPRLIDITNQNFNDWHVDSYAGQGYWNCTCSCGKKSKIRGKDLRKHKTKSCGHNYRWIDSFIQSDKEFIDLTDEIIGDWHVDKYLGNGRWECTCSCGEIRSVLGAELRHGGTKSCGHNTNKFKDLTGQLFGELEVIGYKGNQTWECRCSCGEIITDTSYRLKQHMRDCCNKAKHKRGGMLHKTFGELTTIQYIGNNKWLCECSCGNKISVFTHNLINGCTTSCGCKRYETRYMHMKYKNNRTQEQIKAGSSERDVREYIKEAFGDSKITTEELASLLGIHYGSALRAIKRLNIKDLIKISTDSKQERELYNFLKNNYSGDIDIHNRSIVNGYELDIYIPDKKIAIEFNGNYWHSDYNKDKLYHQKKTIECIKNRVRLIHIFEYEYWDALSKLKTQSFLNDLISDKSIIYAKNTEVTEITSQEAYMFEEKYHLQGHADSDIRIGLKHNDELVGLMTFGKPRFDHNFQYELIRNCFKYNIGIVGGSEKMLKYFIRKYMPANILSYCDISKFDGNSYLRLGFKTDRNMLTTPNYVWVDNSNKQVLKRYQTQKKKLIQQGLGNLGSTEDEIMKNMGYLKIYGSGNMKFVWINGR